MERSMVSVAASFTSATLLVPVPLVVLDLFFFSHVQISP